MESLFKDDATTRVAEQILRQVIEEYLGPDAKERFQKKIEESKAKLESLFNNPLWEQIDEGLTQIGKALPGEPKPEPTATPEPEKEIEIQVDEVKEGYYRTAHCPKCFKEFRYESPDIGKPLRCRGCYRPLRLTQKRSIDR